MAYSEQRRALGESGDWFALGVFYDDFLSSEFSFFGSTVRLTSAAVFAAYGVDIGDGSIYGFSGDRRGVKQWFGQPNEPMDALGLRLSTSPPGITFPPGKNLIGYTATL